MKKLFILPLLILLTGCVTYYHPDTALEDGVYYAEDDPSYVFNSGDYSGVVYYPWSSLDYFYLGYRPYPGFGFVYDYPIGWGYSPWGYPYAYYGNYSPWYFSHSQSSYWRSYNGNCSHHGHCRQDYNDDRNGEPDRNASNDHLNRRKHDGKDGQDEADIRGRDSDIANKGRQPGRRYVSAAPTGHSGNQGNVVTNREGTKIGNNHLEPTDPVPTSQGIVKPSAPGTVFHRPATSMTGTFSRNNTRSPSVSSRSSQPTISGSKSSRPKDRD